MMYHFIFGLRGASTTGVPSALGTGWDPSSAPPAPASFFSSSCIECAKTSAPVVPINRRNRLSAGLKIVEQKLDSAGDEVIDNREVDGEDEYRNHHHGGGRLDLFPGGGGHLAHFGAHVVIESSYALRPGFDPVAKIPAGRCD